MGCTAESDKIRERIRCFLKGKILDLGCRFDKILPSATGIDSYEESKPDILADVTKLDKVFRSGETFDVLFSSHFLEHLKEEPAAVVTKWLEYVREGGYLILYLPDVDYYREQNPEHFWKLKGVEWFSKLLAFNIIVYEKRNVDTGYHDEYSVLMIIQKEEEE